MVVNLNEDEQRQADSFRTLESLTAATKISILKKTIESINSSLALLQNKVKGDINNVKADINKMDDKVEIVNSKLEQLKNDLSNNLEDKFQKMMQAMSRIGGTITPTMTMPSTLSTAPTNETPI